MHPKMNKPISFALGVHNYLYVSVFITLLLISNNENKTSVLFVNSFSTTPIIPTSVANCRNRKRAPSSSSSSSLFLPSKQATATTVGQGGSGSGIATTSSSSLFLSNSNENLLVRSLTSLFPSNVAASAPTPTGSVTSNNNNNNSNVALQFIEALNNGNVNDAMKLFTQDDDDDDDGDDDEVIAEFDDTQFYQPCIGTEQIERRLRLMIGQQQQQQQQQRELVVVDDVAVDYNRNTIGVLFHKEKHQQQQRQRQRQRQKEMKDIPNSRGCIIFHLVDDNKSSSGKNKSIQKVCWVKEPTTRGGEVGLQILSTASNVMQVTGYNPEANDSKKTKKKNTKVPIKQKQNELTPPEQYFEAWNRRDMIAAVDVFDDNLKYEDTAFPEPFVGKEKLQEHLFKCSDGFPSSFQIIIDAVTVDTASNTAACEWHFETMEDNDEGDDSDSSGSGEALPFTQGCSFYKLNKNKIVEGIDFIEPAVIKPGGISLFAKSFQTKLVQEPVRWIPTVSWLAYMYIVFFSDGILPGANALQLEARTWEEVLNLSLNFFLVAPLLDLSFSPSVHPMLEGVFNLLLSWAAMFAGFLSDERRNKPNLLPMFPIVVGMQFLTSAFLLPYLAVRSNEETATSNTVSSEELPLVAKLVGESRILPALMGVVGTGSIGWFFLGRVEEYGTDFAVRYASFIDLLSIDRVGSSFLVDLAIFALFQGWLVDDDLKRRGVVTNGGALETVAKYVPFFGMVAYLLLRPSLSETRDEVD